MSRIQNITGHFRRNQKHARTVQGLLIGVGVAALMSAAWALDVFDGLEVMSADWRRLNFTSGTPGKDVSVMQISQNCLERMVAEQSHSWPWPREAYGVILDYLKQCGAKAVVFDFMFSEFSGKGVEDDKVFIQAITNFRNVVFAAEMGPAPRVSTRTQNFSGLPPEEREEAIQRAKMRQEGAEALRKEWDARLKSIEHFALPVRVEAGAVELPVYDSVSAIPFAWYLKAVAGVGNVRFIADDDGVARRKVLLCKAGGKYYGDLAMVTLCRVLDVKEIVVRGQSLFLAKRAGGQVEIPLDHTGRMLIKFHGPFKRVYSPRKRNLLYAYDPIAAVGDPENAGKLAFKPEDLKDKIVFFGTSATSLMDLRANPFHKEDPGVYLYATVVDNVLRGDYLRELYNPLLVIATILFLSLVTGFATAKLSVLFGLLVTLGLSATWMGINIALFHYNNILVDNAAAQASILLCFLAGTFFNYMRESRQKHFIQGAFSQVLAPAILDKLMEDPTRLGLGGETKELTIFFSDLQGFTTLSEQLGTPARLVDVLNKYLTPMSDVILDSNGYVDKYEGDAIMAFWNAPLDEPGHAWKACHAALDNQTRLKELQVEFRAMGLTADLKVRIGLNTGQAIVGMMGSLKKLNYTVIGDSVNLASRLEGANKQYGTLVMCSESTYAQARDFIEVRELDLLAVKGKTEPTRVYEVVGKKGQWDRETQDLVGVFNEGLAAYRKRDFKRGIECFELALRQKQDDGPSGTYLERCRYFAANPPEADWDGVYRMTTK